MALNRYRSSSKLSVTSAQDEDEWSKQRAGLFMNTTGPGRHSIGGGVDLGADFCYRKSRLHGV